MFEPINRAHSILEASFNLGFVSSLEKSRREELIRGIRDNQELQAFLPKVEELKVRAIQFQAEDVSPSYEDDFGFELKRFKEDGNPEIYFECLSKFVEMIRKKVPQDSYIQNEIDNVVNLVESTKYKLKFLK